MLCKCPFDLYKKRLPSKNIVIHVVDLLFDFEFVYNIILNIIFSRLKQTPLF